MSTLRINNIEAKSVPASPTLDEKIKLTNSSGDVLVHIDGKTSGITTIGINTTASNITFDANSNIVVTGIITATKFVGTIEGSVSGDLSISDKIIHTGDTDTAIRFPAADTITAETGGSERLRIDSSGRLGLGTIPTDYNSNNTAVFQLKDGGSIFSRTGGTFLGMFQNIKYNSSDVTQYITSNPGSAYFQTSGVHKFFTAASGTANNNATLNERLRINSSGALGVGGANYGSSGQVLTSQGSGSVAQWATPASNYKITTGSVINTGNSTSETITGIPSDAVKVELVYYNLKTTASGVMAMRAGNASNIDNQSWFSAHTYVVNTNQNNGDVKTAQWSSRFQMPHQDFTSSANRRTGIFTFTKHIGGTNIWYCVNDMVYSENGTNAIPRNFINKGYIDMGASGFDRIKIFTYSNEVNIDFNGKIQLKYYQVV